MSRIIKTTNPGEEEGEDKEQEETEKTRAVGAGGGKKRVEGVR